MAFSFVNRRPLLLVVALTALAGCDESSPDPDAGSADAGPGTDAGPEADAGPQLESIAAIAAGNPDFSILAAAAERAELIDTLSAPGAFTVFAPTDDAFAASGLTRAAIDAMPVDQLTAVLTYHALAGSVSSADLTAGPVASLSTLSLIVGTTGGVMINGGNGVSGGADVVTADVTASNGVIHIIDRVLLPPTVADLVRYASLTTLGGALDDASLTGTLAGDGPFTVFAPTNEAFDALPALPSGDALTQVLLYHAVGAGVLSSSVPAAASSLSANEYGDNLTLLFDTTDGVRINDRADVVVADVRATNGIVHIVDEVLLPMNVVDAATAADLTGLLGAVTAAAPLGDGTTVAEALAASAPYTVFAPTNEAFAAIESTLSTSSAEQVRDVLLYHVLDPATFTAPVLAADLPAAVTELDTLNADTATLDPTATPPTLEDASIVLTDIVVTNGVVHLIDGVIVPTL